MVFYLSIMLMTPGLQYSQMEQTSSRKNGATEMQVLLLLLQKIIMHQCVLFMIQLKPELVPLLDLVVLMLLWAKIISWSGLIQEKFQKSSSLIRQLCNLTWKDKNLKDTIDLAPLWFILSADLITQSSKSDKTVRQFSSQQMKELI